MYKLGILAKLVLAHLQGTYHCRQEAFPFSGGLHDRILKTWNYVKILSTARLKLEQAAEQHILVLHTAQHWRRFESRSWTFGRLCRIAEEYLHADHLFSLSAPIAILMHPA
jgi:hypothetical protein